MKTFRLFFLIHCSVLLLLCACDGGRGGRAGGSRHTSETAETTGAAVAGDLNGAVAADSPAAPVVKAAPTVNVYVENSGSMNGYVNGVTDFERAVYGYLSDMKNTGVVDSIRFFYINSQIVPFTSGSKDPIRDFIEKLNPSAFVNALGAKGTTDIADILEMMLEKTTDNAMSVFVSDCVFSPGSGKVAHDYMSSQQIAIKADVVDHLKRRPETAFVIYRLTSEFDGIYYNVSNVKTRIDDRRPFFIWLMGGVDHVLALRRQIPEAGFKGGGVTDSHVLPPRGREVKYYIAPSPKAGEFKHDRGDDKRIVGARTSTRPADRGEFMFTVEANLADLHTLLGGDYLLDPANWVVRRNDRPAPEIALAVTEKTPASAGGGFTHRIQLSSSGSVPDGKIRVALIDRTPAWVDEKNDDQGIDVRATGAMDKTFGIKYLIGGVEEAYRTVFGASGTGADAGYRYHAEIEVTVSKK